MTLEIPVSWICAVLAPCAPAVAVVGSLAALLLSARYYLSGLRAPRSDPYFDTAGERCIIGGFGVAVFGTCTIASLQYAGVVAFT